jgi:hypothetical protein
MYLSSQTKKKRNKVAANASSSTSCAYARDMMMMGYARDTRDTKDAFDLLDGVNGIDAV